METKEEHDRTGNNHAAVVLGLERTGRIVTAAAIKMLGIGLHQAAGPVALPGPSVAQAGHGPWGVAGADLGGVLGEEGQASDSGDLKAAELHAVVAAVAGVVG
jgi:hypothetical protein